jgi:hypothetical protein
MSETNSALLFKVNRALAFENARRIKVTELRAKYDRLVAYADRIKEEREHKESQIPLSEREYRMYANRIALAENAVQRAFDELAPLLKERDL